MQQLTKLNLWRNGIDNKIMIDSEQINFNFSHANCAFVEEFH